MDKKRAQMLLGTVRLAVSSTLSAAVVITFLTTQGAQWVRNLASTYLGLVEPPSGPCSVIPDFGHTVEDVEVGSWGRVTWRDVNKLRSDCGQPYIYATISNGGSVLHDAELSTSGVDLPLGVRTISYAFFVDPRLHTGNARFRVVIHYPNARNGAQPSASPWVPFTILPNRNEPGIE